jgi:trk system potassium uptake protein TrkH
MLLVVLMFVGGSAGSTGGGIKVIRFIMLAKIIYRRIESNFRPKTYYALRIDDQVVEEGLQRTVLVFMVLYIAIFAFGCLFMSALGLPFQTAIGSVAATLNNVGPGLELVGAVGNYEFVPAAGKVFLSLCMVLGRLELFSICVLFLPSFWRHS